MKHRRFSASWQEEILPIIKSSWTPLPVWVRAKGAPPIPLLPPPPHTQQEFFVLPQSKFVSYEDIIAEEKAKVVVAFFWGGGVEYIKFLAELAICHQDDLK